MKKNPFFSIAIPTYNRAAKLRFTLYNILRQDYTNYEIIVSDNNSTDDTEKVVTSFKTDKIRYLRNKTNIGGIQNLKKAITHATGRYVFLHGDDDMILYKNTLGQIHDSIIKNNPGYVRINYLCRTDDNKSLFRYPYFKRFHNDTYLKPHADIRKISSYILDSEPYFISGIIFKNELPKNINVINSELCYWIEIIFYLTKEYGSYFISKDYVLASWSKRINTKAPHVLYDLVDGKLASENFLKVFKKYLPRILYESFLYQHVKDIYVYMFPSIKYFTSNENLIKMSDRIRAICPEIAETTDYKIRLFLGLLLPKTVLGLLKRYYFYKFSQLSKLDEVKNKEKILRQITDTEIEFLSTMPQE